MWSGDKADMQPSDEHHSEDKDSLPTVDNGEPVGYEGENSMKQYVEGLQAFTSFVSDMTWPESFDLTKDKDLVVRMFRDFWRMRFRYQRDEERHSERKNGVHHRLTGEDFEAFIHRKMSYRSFDDNEETERIDVGTHQPDDEHLTDDAKNRAKRFKDDWA